MQLKQQLKEQNDQRYKKIGIIFLKISTFIIIATIIIFFVYYVVLDNLTAKEDLKNFFIKPHNINILFMGIDERIDDLGRSDTLFLITVDINSKQTNILSIPRDTRVYIPNIGWDKINHAYAFGGQKRSIETIEKLFNTKIDYYICINIKSFIEIIDIFGGIKIDVEKQMYYEDLYDTSMGKSLLIDLHPGIQHMDGKNAIQYIRYRDKEGDIGRITRQQKFIKAVFSKITETEVLIKIPSNIEKINSVINTNMPITVMFKFAKLLTEVSQQGLNTMMLPGEPIYINNVSYWLPNLIWIREYFSN